MNKSGNPPLRNKRANDQEGTKEEKEVMDVVNSEESLDDSMTNK